MRRLDEALSDLVGTRRADGPDQLIGALRRRLAGEAEVITIPERPEMDTTRSWSRWRGPLIAAGALAAVLMIAFPILWLGGSDETTTAERAPAVAATTAPSTTVAPTTTVLASHLTPAPLQLGDEIGFSQSGDTLWVRDGEGGVAGYHNGVWQALPRLPGRVVDVAGTLDGAVWALNRDETSSTLWYLEQGVWRQLPGERLLPTAVDDVEDVEVDEATGTVWVMSGNGLYRWDGVEMTSGGSPPLEMVLDGITVTGDGTVWASRFNPWFPQLPAGLVRYHPDTGIWESVRPLGGEVDVPAVLAPTSSGDLWVLLADVPEWPRDPLDESPVSWESPSAWVLGYFDSATGEWAIYRLPDGEPGDMVADDEVVWLTHRPLASEESMMVRFDKQTWTTYPRDPTIDNLGMGDDGTLWVTIRYERNGLYRLVIDEEPTG